MTDIAWDATPMGAKISFSDKHTEYSIELDRPELKELSNDSREAHMLARGYEKRDLVAASIEPQDKLWVGDLELNVSDVLDEGGDKRVIQFGYDEMELVVDRFRVIEVWRVIE